MSSRSKSGIKMNSDKNNSSEYFFHLESERLKSFGKNWPFRTGNLAPAKMAKAGWCHKPTKAARDIAQCYFCFKELEGWEKGDDPRVEHKKHSKDCLFLQLDKPIKELTVEEFFRLEIQRQKNKTIKNFEAKQKEIAELDNNTRNELLKLS